MTNSPPDPPAGLLHTPTHIVTIKAGIIAIHRAVQHVYARAVTTSYTTVPGSTEQRS